MRRSPRRPLAGSTGAVVRLAGSTTSPSIPIVSAAPATPLRYQRGAELVTRYFFPISPRTLEAWPLDWLQVNAKATCATAELFAVAQAKLDAAPLTRTARRHAA